MTIIKNEEDVKILMEALANPPKPNERLKRARLTYIRIKEELEK